jgi:hypothetical protein
MGGLKILSVWPDTTDGASGFHSSALRNDKDRFFKKEKKIVFSCLCVTFNCRLSEIVRPPVLSRTPLYIVKYPDGWVIAGGEQRSSAPLTSVLALHPKSLFTRHSVAVYQIATHCTRVQILHTTIRAVTQSAMVHVRTQILARAWSVNDKSGRPHPGHDQPGVLSSGISSAQLSLVASPLE